MCILKRVYMELSSFILWHHWDVISCMHKWNSLVKHVITKSGALSMISFSFVLLSRSLCFFPFLFCAGVSILNLTLWVRQSTSSPKIQTLLTQDLILWIIEAIVRNRCLFPGYTVSNPSKKGILYSMQGFHPGVNICLRYVCRIWHTM